MTDKDRDQYMEVLLALAGHGYNPRKEEENRQSISQIEKERKKSFFGTFFSKTCHDLS